MRICRRSHQNLLGPGKLPELWATDSITVQNVIDYFDGSKVVQFQRDGYMEPMSIPKASEEVINLAISQAVDAGTLWLTNGPASILAEPIPAGVLAPQAALHRPPATIAAAEILPEPLPDAWTDGTASAMSISVALSQKFGQTLPWKSVRDVISASINARFTELDPTSGSWPCEFAAAQGIKLRVASGVGGGAGGGSGHGGSGGAVREIRGPIAHADLNSNEMQDLGDIIPQLLEVKTKASVPLDFRVEIKFGDVESPPTAEAIAEINVLLENLKEGFSLQQY